MKPVDINKQLLNTIPEIKELFDSVANWQDGIETGSTIIIEDVFMVFLKSCIKSNDKAGISKCTLFLEWLSDFIDDDYAGEILVISVFEYIHYASDQIELEKVLGTKAKAKYLSISWK